MISERGGSLAAPVQHGVPLALVGFARAVAGLAARGDVEPCAPAGAGVGLAKGLSVDLKNRLRVAESMVLSQKQSLKMFR